MDYGKRIKELRNKAGLTQAQLAEIIGFRTPFYLSQLETGKRDAGLSVLSKICNGLNIELSDFFKKEKQKVTKFEQILIQDLLEEMSKEKLELVREYIETVKDMDIETVKVTLLSAQKEKLWIERSRRKKQTRRTSK
ncbi:MAG: helix-turn-helix transcriptional regulator [Thermodesulfovibrionales bacterium]|nr:helix-turn-helix transcriptional regulator [Thermodesulfovibrionales bacterium]